MLALFPGGIIIIPALVTYWRGTKRVMGASKLAGQPPLNGWIAIILYVLISPALWGYIQVRAEQGLGSRGRPGFEGELAPPAPADPMPPPLPEQPPATEPPAADPPPAGPTA